MKGAQPAVAPEFALSRSPALSLLEGWRVVATGRRGGPARRAGRRLGMLGASVIAASGPERLKAIRPRGGVATLEFGTCPERERPSGAGVPGEVDAEYIALAAAEAILRGIERLDPTAVLLRCLDLPMGALRSGVTRRRYGPHWLAAALRSRDEDVLLEALLAAEGGVSDGLWTAAGECRLLVAPLRRQPRPVQFGPRAPVLRPRRVRRSPSLRLLDWTSLWAGPAATADLLRSLRASVTRVENPRCRDGLLASPHGSELWRQWNGEKDLLFADIDTEVGRRRIEAEIIRADVLVTGNTPRVLPNIGLDSRWFEEHAPDLLHVELVAYEPPHDMAPGLGSLAAAVTGLLWRDPREPWRPLPLADPLAAAWISLLVAAWDTGGATSAGRIRISLESAAALAVLGQED